MVRTIIAVLILLLILYVGYHFWWVPREHAMQADNGSYTCTGCLTGEAKERFLRENSGETADGASERKDESARVAAEEAAAGTTVGPNSAPAPYNNGTPGTSTMVAPSYPSAGPSYPSATNAPAPPPNSVPTTTYNSMGAPPPGDTLSPNPPNGMVFAGKGSYQWYRQGDITWRVDTITGRSCIIYATMEEWQKQIVMRHGCGRAA